MIALVIIKNENTLSKSAVCGQDRSINGILVYVIDDEVDRVTILGDGASVICTKDYNDMYVERILNRLFMIINQLDRSSLADSISDSGDVHELIEYLTNWTNLDRFSYVVMA